jgi:hypothetical protein
MRNHFKRECKAQSAEWTWQCAAISPENEHELHADLLSQPRIPKEKHTCDRWVDVSSSSRYVKWIRHKSGTSHAQMSTSDAFGTTPPPLSGHREHKRVTH